MSTEELPESGTTHNADLMRRLCALTGVDLMEMQRCMTSYESRCRQLTSQCCELENKYNTLEDLYRRANCPANVLYSEVTIAEVSDDNQVQLTETGSSPETGAQTSLSTLSAVGTRPS